MLSRHSSSQPTPTPAPRPTSEVLDSFDPLQSSASSSLSERASSQSRSSPFKPFTDSQGLGSSAVTLVSADGITSPDQGIASSTESVKTASATSLLEDNNAGGGSGGNSRPDSGVEATDAAAVMNELAESMADGLKLTECQNTRIDAHRLSSGFALFDPLLQENTAAGTDNAGATGAESSSQQKVQQQHQGARPKVPQPRISVNDLDVGRGGGGKVRENGGPISSSSPHQVVAAVNDDHMLNESPIRPDHASTPIKVNKVLVIC